MEGAGAHIIVQRSVRRLITLRTAHFVRSANDYWPIRHCRMDSLTVLSHTMDMDDKVSVEIAYVEYE